MAMRYYAPFPSGGGNPARPREPHALRIGDAERDAAAMDLGEHYAAGRLTLDELDERLEAVFSAKTFGQLNRIMADLPGPGRVAWHTGPARPPATARPGVGPQGAWDPAIFPYAHVGMAGGPWPAADLADDGYLAGEPREPRTSSDRASRFAALSLLLVAMLIWLFTALLFARHGMYHQGGSFGAHTLQYQMPGPGYYQNAPGAP